MDTVSSIYPSRVCKTCSHQIRSSYTFAINAFRCQNILQRTFVNAPIKKTDVVKIVKPKEKNRKEITTKKELKKSQTTSIVVNNGEIKILPKIAEAQKSPYIMYKCRSLVPGLLTPVPQESQVFLLPGAGGAPPPQCLRCSKQFLTKAHLQTHMQCYHLQIRTTTSCSTCDISFDTPEDLTKHNLEVHFPSTQANNKVKCHVCAKEYRDKYLLAKHKDKVHSAAATQKAAEAQKNLQILREAEPVGFGCRICRRDFVCARSLSLHMKAHRGPACMYCGRAFCSPEALRQHAAVHDNQPRPFSCLYCPKKFILKKVLVRHERLRHGSMRDVYACGHCETLPEPNPDPDLPQDSLEKQDKILFVGKAALLEHMRLHHQDPNIEQKPNEKYPETSDYVFTYQSTDAGTSIKIEQEETSTLTHTQTVEPSKEEAHAVTENPQFMDTIVWESEIEDSDIVVQVSSENLYETENVHDITIVSPDVAESLPANQKGVLSQDDTQTENSEKDTFNFNGQVSMSVDSATGKVTYKKMDGNAIDEGDIVRPDNTRMADFKVNSNPPCQWCGEKFSGVHFLKKHVLKKHGVRSHRIEGVLSKQSEKDLADTIKKSQHSATSMPYGCPKCPKTFMRIANLQRHLTKHNKAKLRTHSTPDDKLGEEDDVDRLKCPTCNKRLTTAAGLRYHMQTHSLLRRFLCPVCGRRFLTRGNLRAHHRAVHMDARPHACALCPRRFSSADHLRKHQVSHEDRRDHLCGVCGRAFLQRSHARQHMWLHTGVKPHTCKHCPAKYTAKCSLTKHLRRNHLVQQVQEKLAEEQMYRDLGEDHEDPDSITQRAVKNMVLMDQESSNPDENMADFSKFSIQEDDLILQVNSMPIPAMEEIKTKKKQSKSYKSYSVLKTPEISDATLKNKANTTAVDNLSILSVSHVKNNDTNSKLSKESNLEVLKSIQKANKGGVSVLQGNNKRPLILSSASNKKICTPNHKASFIVATAQSNLTILPKQSTSKNINKTKVLSLKNNSSKTVQKKSTRILQKPKEIPYKEQECDFESETFLLDISTSEDIDQGGMVTLGEEMIPQYEEIDAAEVETLSIDYNDCTAQYYTQNQNECLTKLNESNLLSSQNLVISNDVINAEYYEEVVNGQNINDKKKRYIRMDKLTFEGIENAHGNIISERNIETLNDGNTIIMENFSERDENDKSVDFVVENMEEANKIDGLQNAIFRHGNIIIEGITEEDFNDGVSVVIVGEGDGDMAAILNLEEDGEKQDYDI